MPDYVRRVRRVLLVVLGLNAVVAVAKLVAGWRADSLAVTGDGLHSLMDALANLAGLLVLHVATAPPDREHPFGHSKFETLAALIISGLLLLTGFELGKEALERLLTGEAPRFEALTVAVLVATLLVNLAVARYERRVGRELDSDFLLADAAQTHGDVFVTLALLAGIGAGHLGVPYVDAVLAMGVAVLIVYIAYGVLREAAPVLTDRALYEPAAVARLVHEVPGVVNVHDIRSRGTPREAFLQMHLVVDTRDVVKAHAITDAVERKLEDELGVREVLIHLEPYDDRSGPPGTSGA